MSLIVLPVQVIYISILVIILGFAVLSLAIFLRMDDMFKKYLTLFDEKYNAKNAVMVKVEPDSKYFLKLSGSTEYSEEAVRHILDYFKSQNSEITIVFDETK